MIIRKVTALEEQILALTVEWASQQEEIDARISAYGSLAGRLKPPEIVLMRRARDRIGLTVLRLAKRLRKQCGKAAK